MVFSSAVFLFAFFPVYIAVVTLVRNIRACNVLLVIMSLVFYAWGEPVYILLMLFSIFVNYLLALPAEKYRDGDSVKKRAFLSLAIVFNLTALGLFKYAGFLVSTFNTVTGSLIPVLCSLQRSADSASCGNIILHISNHELCDRRISRRLFSSTEYRKIHFVCFILSAAYRGTYCQISRY